MVFPPERVSVCNQFGCYGICLGGHLEHLLRLVPGTIGNGRNTVSRVLFRRRELTEFWGKLGEFWGKLGEFAFTHK